MLWSVNALMSLVRGLLTVMADAEAEAEGIRRVSLACFLQTNIPFTRTEALARHITDHGVSKLSCAMT